MSTSVPSVRTTSTRSDRFLRLAFGANVLAAGAPGAVLLVAPATGAELLFGVPAHPFVATVLGSVWVGIALVSLLGLREPGRWRGVLGLQIAYKAVWVVAGATQLLATGVAPPITVPFILFFALVVACWTAALRSEPAERA